MMEPVYSGQKPDVFEQVLLRDPEKRFRDEVAQERDKRMSDKEHACSKIE